MSLNNTQRSERVHIALFGRRNAGKSSVINAITNQELSIVSEIKGTTTDPVYKSIEILPIGPCVIIDTAGLDDFGSLGELRKSKTIEVLNKTDIAIVVIDSNEMITSQDMEIINEIKGKKLPYIIVINKSDEREASIKEIKELEDKFKTSVLQASAKSGDGIEKLKEKITKVLPKEENPISLVDNLAKKGDLVVLVVPIDSAAPKGRLILPQQQTIRELLDIGAIPVVTKDTELKDTLESLKVKPKLVITDSQAFEKISKLVPQDISLTGFSLLFARYKGDLEELIKGAKAIRNLKDGDRVLISEGCTHHRQEDDIGTVKIPKWLKMKTGKNLNFEYSSGMSFTKDVTKYSLIIHCGACMLNRNAMLSRIEQAKEYEIPMVNYGIMIAYVKGILDRALKPFKEAEDIWKNN